MLLLLASLGVSRAAPADLGTHVTVTDPLGLVLVDQDAPLPWTSETIATYGKVTIALVVTAEAAGHDATVKLEVYEVKGQQRTKLASPSLTLPPDKASTEHRVVAAPKGAKAPDGSKLTVMDWGLSASWGWTGPDWTATLRDQAVPAGAVVVVPETTWLRSRPEADAPGVRLAAEGGRTLALEVLADQGGWLQVRPLVGEACGPAPTLRVPELTAWVARGDLLLVTPAPVTVTYSDGTVSTVDAGAAALPTPVKPSVVDAERVFLLHDGLLLAPVALPAGSLALSHPRGAARPAPAGADHFVMPRSDGEVVSTLAGGTRWIGTGPALLAERFEVESTRNAGVVIRGRCSEHRGEVQAARVKPLAAASEAPPPPPPLSDGGPPVQVRWSDGGVVGNLPAGRFGLTDAQAKALSPTGPCLGVALDTGVELKDGGPDVGGLQVCAVPK